MLKSVEVFKAGTHRSISGKVFTFTPEDVAGIAAAYDPSLLRAPAVLGHPKTDGPAWAWAERFVENDGILTAEWEDGATDPAFAEGVEAKRYRYTSMSLYEPTDPYNPKPGTWYPRHIGYLGAQPPAIKGLQPAFSEAGQDFETFVAFSEYDTVSLARTVSEAFRRLRDWMIDKFDLETADRVLPQWSDQYAAEIGSRLSAEIDGDRALFSEPEISDIQTKLMDVIGDKLTSLQAREEAVAAREQAAQRSEVAFAEAELIANRSDDAAFVEGLVAAGRLPPGYKDSVLALFGQAAGDAGGVAFSEGADARSTLRQLLEGLGTVIAFSEVSASDGFDGITDPTAVAREIDRIRSDAASRGETLSASQAAARIGR